MRRVLSQRYRRGNYSTERVNILPKATQWGVKEPGSDPGNLAPELSQRGPSTCSEASTGHQTGTERPLPYHIFLATLSPYELDGALRPRVLDAPS